jgi:MFS family permease
MESLDQRCALTTAALGFAHLPWCGPVPTPFRVLGRGRSTPGRGIGAVLVGMTAQSFSIELKQFSDGWRATFYPVWIALRGPGDGVRADRVGRRAASSVGGAHASASPARAVASLRTPPSTTQGTSRLVGALQQALPHTIRGKNARFVLDAAFDLSWRVAAATCPGREERTVRDYDRIARKITLLLFVSQSLSSAGFIAAFTVNALIGVELTGRPSMAGVPGALYVVGQACGAMVWAATLEHLGRRRGLSLGQTIGLIGAVICVAAVVDRSFLAFLLGLVLLGVARSAVDLARFAAADVYLPDRRGRAISQVVLGGTVGAVAGPLLVGPVARLALLTGFPELAGPYAVSGAALLVAALLIFTGLRPDPRDVGRELARLHPAAVPHTPTRSLARIVRQPEVVVAMAAMVFSQMVMIVPMSITAVHMKDHHHALTGVSLVISVHAVGMYAFSIVSGRLTDRWGRGPSIILGVIILNLSCLLSAPSINLLPLAAGLFLLGLGWNFAYVSGSTLLADQLSPAERAKTQGLNDLLLNLTSAVSQVGSGIVYAAGGYAVVSLVAAAVALVPLALTVWWKVTAGRRTCPVAG